MGLHGIFLSFSPKKTYKPIKGMFQHTMAEAVGLAYLMFGLIADSSALPSTSKHEVTVSVARCPCGWAWPAPMTMEICWWRWSRKLIKNGCSPWDVVGMVLGCCWDVGIPPPENHELRHSSSKTGLDQAKISTHSQLNGKKHLWQSHY